MSDLYPVAGCRIFIAGTISLGLVDLTAADFPDFDSPDWIEIDGWNQMGALGDSANLITTPLINRGRDVKQKGTANAGSMANTFAVVDGDPGQAALLVAGEGTNKSNYAFRVDLNDAVAPGTPSRRLFAAVVMGTPEAGGDANTIRNLTPTLEINSNIVRIAKGA